MRQLTHILPACGANLGGLVHIRVYPAANVRRIPDPVGGILAEPVVLLDQQNFCDIFFPNAEGLLDEGGAEDEHGNYFKIKVSAFVPQDTPEFYDATLALTGMACIVLCMDNNGLARLVGTPEFPLRFKLSTSTGKRTRDKNGMDFEFSGMAPHRAPFCLTLDNLSPEPRKRFSAGFTFAFRRN